MDKTDILSRLTRVAAKKDPIDLLFFKSLKQKVKDSLDKGTESYDLTSGWADVIDDLQVSDKIDGPKGTILRLLTTKDDKYLIFLNRRCLHSGDSDEVWTEIKARMSMIVPLVKDREKNHAAKDKGSAGQGFFTARPHAHDKDLSRTNEYGTKGEPYYDMDPARRIPMFIWPDQTRGGNPENVNTTPGQLAQFFGTAEKSMTRIATHFLHDDPFISVIGMPGGCKAHVAETLALFYGLPLYDSIGLMAESGARNTRVGRALSDAVLKGRIPPEGLIADAVAEFVRTLDGAVLLDYPNNVQQLWGLPLTIMANIDADIERVGTHIAGTRWCKTCFSVFHLKHNPPLRKGICDRCGSNLMLRPDHTLPTTRKAYANYANDRGSVLDYARDLEILLEFGPSQSPLDVARSIDRVLLRPQDKDGLVHDGRVLDRA